jgi:site-specific DNA-methyltransferase (adenine-specific)
MNRLNHYAISAILGSEIVGRVKVGHGQIASVANAQQYFERHGAMDAKAPARSGDHDIDIALLRKAFMRARRECGDRFSTDRYVAEPKRNRVFLAKCRELGLRASDYVLNKTLFNARKNRLLRDLKSKRTHVPYDEFAFASEFAATELRYLLGASIDEILCDPDLAAKFDAVAMRIRPGFTSLDYRWAILSIRKAGRHYKLDPSFKMPSFRKGFRLTHDPIESIPDLSGVYLLYERKRLLYARSTSQLRHGISLHRDPVTVEAIAEKLWIPDVKDFRVDYAAVLQPNPVLQAIERKLVEERHPVFNIPRTAA